MRLLLILGGTLGVLLIAGGPAAHADSVGERTRELRTIYNYLYQEDVVEHADGHKTFHDASLFKREGVNVLHLKGDSFEMAFQHGTLLKEEILVGAPRISAATLENKVRETLGHKPLLVRMVTNNYHRRYTEAILDYSLELAREQGLEHVLDELIGMSESTGIDADELVRALFLPEVLMVIAKDTVEDEKSVEVDRLGPLQTPITPMVGQCSDFMAWGDYTQDGSLVIGRNTDYAVNGYYDRFPTVIYFEPNDKQRFMTIVSSGVHNTGLVSLNEAGIFIGVHTIPANKVSTEGVPVFMIANRVMRNADSFDKAVEIFGAANTNGGWTYSIASVKEKKYGTLEFHAEGVSLRAANDSGLHVQTNRFMTDKFAQDELFFNKSVDFDSDARYARIEQMANEWKGTLDAKKAMAIMGDHTDPFSGQVRAFPNTVSVHTTVTSAVLEPEKNRVFVANGMAPVSETTFVELPTVNNFDPATFLSQPYTTHLNDDFARNHPQMAAGLQKFIEAKNAYEQRFDLEDSLAKMEEAIALDESNPSYKFVAAMVYLRKGDFSKGRAHLENLLKTDHVSPQKELLGQYYLGRIAAHRNQRAVARNYLEFVVANAMDHKLKSAAEKALKSMRGIGRRYNLGRKSLMIMFQQADMLHY
jgi:tetratricopeptide (TPR) repeat protein